MFVPRSAANPEPPEQITSPDGILQATTRLLPCTSQVATDCSPSVGQSSCPGGVLLRADFGSTYPDQLPKNRHNLAAAAKMNDNTDMSSGGSATKEPSDEWYHEGRDKRSIKVTDTSGSGASGVYPITTAPGITDVQFTPGAWYQCSVWVRRDGVASPGAAGPHMTFNYSQTGSGINYAWAVSNYLPNDIGTEGQLTVEFQVPEDYVEGTSYLSMRVLVGAGVAGAVLYVDDLLLEEVDGPGLPFGDYFDDATPDTAHRHYEKLSDGTFLSVNRNPIVWVRFSRGDGTLVRSGNDAWAPDGVAYAYDDEVPFGDAVSWSAVPVYADGTLGPESQGVAMALPEPEGCYDSWIKSIDAPQYDQQVFITADEAPTFTYAAKNNIDYPQGSKYPVGTVDVHNAATATLTAYTATDEEEDRMHDLLESGHLLFQTASKYHIPDFYFIVGDITMNVVWVTDRNLFARKWSIPVTVTDRPDPYGSPLIIPGEAYSDMPDQTYAQLANQWSSYRALTEAGRVVA